jgi:hypothetical protein
VVIAWPRTCSGLAYSGVSGRTAVSVRSPGAVPGWSNLRDAEVKQPRHAVCRDQHIARLDVAMDDQILVRVSDRGADTLEQLQALGDRQVPSIAVLVDRLALDELHDEVGQAVVGRPSVEQARDVGVIESGQDLALAAESLDDVVRVQPAPEDLDRDTLLERVVGPRGQINASHPSATDLAQDAVGANPALLA